MAHMVNFFKKLFGQRPEETPIESKSESKYAHCRVEYYPLTGKYFPRYKNKYIVYRFQTGIYDFLEHYLFTFAESARTESEAWDIIDKVLEQQLKENVKVLRRE